MWITNADLPAGLSSSIAQSSTSVQRLSKEVVENASFQSLRNYISGYRKPLRMADMTKGLQEEMVELELDLTDADAEESEVVAI